MIRGEQNIWFTFSFDKNGNVLKYSFNKKSNKRWIFSDYGYTKKFKWNVKSDSIFEFMGRSEKIIKVSGDTLFTTNLNYKKDSKYIRVSENLNIQPPSVLHGVDQDKINPDHLGTSTFLTDANGVAYQFFLNLPFGETMAEQRPSTYFATNYKFNGKELDEETGLYYYGARYYDPRISIWYSTDPLAEKYPGVNPYVYCLQNPVNMIDPDGRDVIFWYVTHLEPTTNYPIYDKKHFLSRDFAFTMTSIMRTNTGKDYISQFMKKDQTLFGITAEKNGKYSDVNLNIVQYDLKGDDQAKSGIIFSEKDGVTTVTEVNGKLMINIYVRSMNPSPDDICHEIFVHNASQIKQIVDAYKKGGIKAVQAILTSADIDHIALRDLDIKHKGIEKYKKISDELSENPAFKKIFEKNIEVNKRKYEGLEKK